MRAQIALKSASEHGSVSGVPSGRKSVVRVLMVDLSITHLHHFRQITIIIDDLPAPWLKQYCLVTHSYM